MDQDQNYYCGLEELVLVKVVMGLKRPSAIRNVILYESKPLNVPVHTYMQTIFNLRESLFININIILIDFYDAEIKLKQLILILLIEI